MDDEPLPGTSKQIEDISEASQKNSEIDKHGNGTASETSMSNSNSDNSNMGHERMGNTAPANRKERKPRERKKKRKRAAVGRVTKRGRRVEATKLARGRSKRNTREKKRHISVSTVFTKLSGTEPPPEICRYCGHRCCNRRYYEYHRNIRKILRKNRGRRIGNNRIRRKFKRMGTQTVVKRKMLKRCIQVGSTALMLSPLCVNTGPNPQVPPEEASPSLGSFEITPEMIINALRRLSMLRSLVETKSILKYLKCNYPVGGGQKLLDELNWKLYIATKVGIVTQPAPGKWALTCALMRRKLDKNHVTLFWDVYRNSLNPVRKKCSLTIQEQNEII